MKRNKGSIFTEKEKTNATGQAQLGKYFSIVGISSLVESYNTYTVSHLGILVYVQFNQQSNSSTRCSTNLTQF